MVLCWAPGCNHYNVREKCKFFRFPKDQKVRNRWIQLTRLVKIVHLCFNLLLCKIIVYIEGQ